MQVTGINMTRATLQRHFIVTWDAEPRHVSSSVVLVEDGVRKKKGVEMKSREKYRGKTIIKELELKYRES